MGQVHSNNGKISVNEIGECDIPPHQPGKIPEDYPAEPATSCKQPGALPTFWTCQYQPHDVSTEYIQWWIGAHEEGLKNYMIWYNYIFYLTFIENVDGLNLYTFALKSTYDGWHCHRFQHGMTAEAKSATCKALVAIPLDCPSICLQKMRPQFLCKNKYIFISCIELCGISKWLVG